VYNNSTGKITVSGTANVTSANITATQGTIFILSMSDTTTADRLVIEGGTVGNTSASTGNVIRNNSGGGVTISGGIVSATGTSVYAVNNNSTGALTISGGTVSATGTSGRAVHNQSTGAVTISGGTISATEGAASAYAVYINNSGATVNITEPPAVITGNKYGITP